MKLKIRLLLISVLLIQVVYSYFNLEKEYYFEMYDEVEKSFSENNDDNVEQLILKYNNSDIKGIITINGEEDFNYPIVKSINNDYYLTHDYYKNYDKYGSVVLDYRVDLDNSKKIILYGHSSKYEDTYFNKLELYYNKSYYDNHKYINIVTENNNYRYEIFSVYVETEDFSYMNLNFANKSDWYQHLVTLKNKSIYDIDIDLDKNDSILIMQTCSNSSYYSSYDKKYLLIISRRVNIEKS